MVLSNETADSVARALFSGKAGILYGPSGNGKTKILERFAHDLEGWVLVPYAIYAYGQVIRVLDQSIHEPVEDFDEAMKDDSRFDRRWVMEKRPAVMLGCGGCRTRCRSRTRPGRSSRKSCATPSVRRR